MTQQAISFGARYDAEAEYDMLLEAVEAACDAIGKGEVAWRLNIKPATLANALKRRNRTELKAWQLIGIMSLDEGGLVLRKLAELRGYQLHEQRPLTDREKRERLEERLRRAFPEHAEALISDANGGRR